MKQDENTGLEYTHDYNTWLTEIKSKIRSARLKVVLAANTELILFYFDLGKDIAGKMKQNVWGNKVLEVLSKDLKDEFPDATGFSRTNLYNCLKFYSFYAESLIVQRSIGQIENTENSVDVDFVQRSIGQIPWRHNVLIITKTKSIEEALFYIEQTIENGWSMDVLAFQIKANLYQRQGKAITNFANTLQNPTSDLAQQTLKDPYFFDFVSITAKSKERDIELQLTQHITRFLLELGKGFAFIGRQYPLKLQDKEYFIDLLFYHIPMKCYVVVELKNKDFEPEHVGKLNFYLTLVDKTLKQESDNATIGILLCRGKNNLEVEYALQDVHKPMGVSEFTLDELLPPDLKSNLPTIEEFEQQLKKLEDAE